MKSLIVSLFLTVALTTSAVADAAGDKEAFRATYKNYQQAVANSDISEALKYARQAYQLGENIYGPNHKNTASLLLNYGRLIYKQEQAQPILKDAVSRFEKIYGEDAVELIDPLMDLAAASNSLGRLGNARSIYKRILTLTQIHFPDDPHMEGGIRLEIGKVALQEAYSRSAINYLEDAKRLLSGVQDDTALPQLAEANFYIGKYMIATKKYDEATSYLLSSLDLFEKYAPNSRTTMSNHAFLIQVYEERNMSDEATKHCRAIGQKKPTRPDQDYMPIYRVAPHFPRFALSKRVEGYAIVELTVDKDGFVKDPVVIENGGYNGFKAASLDAVVKFRYAPRYENGAPVDTPGVRYKFSFNIAS